MHKYCTSVVKLLLSHNIQYTRGTYLLSQNIPEVYIGVCEKMPGTPVIDFGSDIYYFTFTLLYFTCTTFYYFTIDAMQFQ